MSGFPSRAVQALALALLLCTQRGSADVPQIGSAGVSPGAPTEASSSAPADVPDGAPAGAVVAEPIAEARVPVQAGETPPLPSHATEPVAEARVAVQAEEMAPLLAPAMEPVTPPCPREGDVVTVITGKRELWLCRQGTSVAKFHVALGRGGLDKRRRGDRRTPLGTYSFGEPRESSRFGVFIPIGYPTADQVAQGFTGSNVGIHGPPRDFVAVTYPVISDDWTEGCIATGLDAEIAYIAEFVRAWQPLLVIR